MAPTLTGCAWRSPGPACEDVVTVRTGRRACPASIASRRRWGGWRMAEGSASPDRSRCPTNGCERSCSAGTSVGVRQGSSCGRTSPSTPASTATGRCATPWPKTSLLGAIELSRCSGVSRRRRPRGSPAGRVLVEILLCEGDTDAAWQAAVDGGCSEELWLRLAYAPATARPDEAIPVLLRAAHTGRSTTRTATLPSRRPAVG